MIKFAATFFVLAACAAQAQNLKIPESFDKLAAKAQEVVDVKLDAATLGLAAKSQSGKESQAAVGLNNVSKIKGGFVRSYKFEQEGEYSQADVEAVRSQLRESGWSCIVNVRNNKKGETARVCFHSTGGTPDALAVLAAEPKELTIVNLVGTGDLAQLGALGNLDMPAMSFSNQR